MPLTPDNSQLSRPTFAEFRVHTKTQRGVPESSNYEAQVDEKAIDPSTQSESILTYPLTVRDYVRESVSLNTRRAYAADLNHFIEWGGSIPAEPHLVADYLAAIAESYKVATIRRHLASISKAHASAGSRNPCKDELVRATMRGIRRRLSMVQKQARPLLRDDLFALLDRMTYSPKDMRDRALLLVGFATAMRRTELVGLDFEDIQYVEQGMLITLRSSKTDQEGRGRSIAVPFGRTRHCPVMALRNWLLQASVEAGPIFLSVNRHGQIAPSRISAEAVTHILRERLKVAGYEPKCFSGHSLRAGFATSAAQAGAASHKIRQTTGHRSDTSLARYVRDVDLFEDAAVAKLI
jgi:integrase